ncbi:MAG: inorganic diphosphatase [Alphaproteobacteria bacterium]|nr:inorganic diphosphatase [Alphaproteobacteria bacterium]
MNLEAIPIGKNPPEDVNVIIEIPLGGEPIKYEMDKVSGALFVDRFLHTSMHYPCNYGFIPQTLSNDGDPIDALVVGMYPITPGAIVRSSPVGVLRMEDEAGLDEKLLMVPFKSLTPFYENVTSYLDLPNILIEQITHFFTHYKDLEKNKWIKIQAWGDAEDARLLIREAYERAKQKG